MRYSLEVRKRKYVEWYGFLPFPRKLGDKFGKELMDTATKAGIDAAKTASKRVVQKTAKATGDFTGNKKAQKTTSVGKTKNKRKVIWNKFTYHQKKTANYGWLKTVLDIV